jgi:sucrose-6-phosphate hydrolase SacC (GH32 family)
LYERHASKEPQAFGPDSHVLIGPRNAGNGDFFAGAIDDARIYDRALTAEELAALRPNVIRGMGDQPWAWWTFDDEACKERTGRFAAAQLSGGAKVEGGHLLLDGKRAAFCGARTPELLGGFAPGALPPSLAYLPDLPGDITIARRFRNHLLADPYRPAYHFVIPEDYAGPFDPNGAIFWRGLYHLFYIYQENHVHVFGHVSSVDMVHWRQHPTPLFPTADSVDRGMFSGNCFINKKGEATMLFHGVGAGNCIATSTDDSLDRWTRLPSNPIVPNTTNKTVYASWDPHGWVEGDTYYAIFGGNPGSATPASVFKASELDGWSYVGPFLRHEMPDVAANEDISCPDFFTLGNKRVLVCIAHNRGTRYYVGEWKNEQFVPETHARLSWADNLYFAPETLLTPDGRRVLWAWIFDQRSAETRAASGWSGELALPRELALGDDGLLRFRPLEELKRLRYSEQAIGKLALPADQEVELPAFKGNAIELETTFEPGGARQVGVKVCRSPDREEETLVYYDAAEQKLKIDTGRSSLAEGPKSVEAAPYALKAGEPLALRVFVDKSVVEVFTGDGRQALVRRMYPVRADSVGVSAFATGGAATLRAARAWQMAPSNMY